MTTSQAPVVVELTLHYTEENKRKLSLLSRLETMLDDPANTIPPEWYTFDDTIQWGDRVKITLEILK